MTSPQRNNVNVMRVFQILKDVNVVMDIIYIKYQVYTMSYFSHLYLTPTDY